MTLNTLALLLIVAAGIAASVYLIPRRNKGLQRLLAAGKKTEDAGGRSVETDDADSWISALRDRLYFSKGISPRPRAFVAGVPVLFALAGFVMVLLGGEGLGAVGVLVILLGPTVVYLDSSRRSQTRRKAFAEDLPPFLLTVASAMSAGLTLEQALRELSAGASNVVEEEFTRAMQGISLGETLEAALAEMAERMNSPELLTLRQATTIGRETGSSLTPILETVAESSLERAQVRREIGTLTAEGLMSAYVVIALPFLVFIFLFLSQPDYVSVLWTRPAGIGMAVAAVGLIAVGWIWLRRLISQETSAL